MTGGGSESILTMMKACRDYSRFVKGIRNPEMIIGDSAHAAYFKGAEYFKIKLVMVPVGADYRLSGKAVKKAVTRNTILVIASAPGFPHGVIDHIEDIAQVRHSQVTFRGVVQAGLIITRCHNCTSRLPLHYLYNNCPLNQNLVNLCCCNLQLKGDAHSAMVVLSAKLP